MSSDNIVCTNQLLVRFDQLENGTVNWLVQADDKVCATLEASYDELARAGAPLSALGIRALWDLLGEDLVTLALEKANGYLWKALAAQQGEWLAQIAPGHDATGDGADEVAGRQALMLH